MASQEESVREFVAVTDVDEERARFFLESAGWNLQARLLRNFPGGSGGPRSGPSEGNSGYIRLCRLMLAALPVICASHRLTDS